MRRRFSAVLIALALSLVATFATAAGPAAEYFKTVTASQSSQFAAFTSAGAPFYGCPLVVNDGASTVYVSFVSTTATTSSLKVLAGERLGECIFSTKGVAVVTGTGGSASVRVYGFKDVR